MKDLKKQLKRYARLLIENGVHLKKGQLLVITLPVEQVEFGLLFKETAYEYGAGLVEMEYRDDASSRIDYLYADEKVLS